MKQRKTSSAGIGRVSDTPGTRGHRDHQGNRARHAARSAKHPAVREQAPSPFWETAPAALEPARLPEENFSVQVAARHYVRPLLEELGSRVLGARGRLVLARGSAPAAWAQNVWLQPLWLPVASIGDAARQLTALQRNWRAHVPPPGVEPGFRRRLALIGERLPHVGTRPLAFGSPMPTAPLGAFTLWRDDLLLASPRTTSAFADGELLQLSNVSNLEFSEEVYFDVIHKKTAVLFAACTKAGALSAGAGADEIERARRFGECIGLCFQIKDDIFDYYESKEIGKPTGNDMHEGKLTLPVLRALNTTNDAEAARIAVLVKQGHASAQEIAWLVQFTKDHGGIESATQTMYSLRDEALGLLSDLPDTDVKQALVAYLDYVVKRDK